MTFLISLDLRTIFILLTKLSFMNFPWCYEFCNHYLDSPPSILTAYSEISCTFSFFLIINTFRYNCILTFTFLFVLHLSTFLIYPFLSTALLSVYLNYCQTCYIFWCDGSTWKRSLEMG